jgi:hypothetical protein
MDTVHFDVQKLERTCIALKGPVEAHGFVKAVIITGAQHVPVRTEIIFIFMHTAEDWISGHRVFLLQDCGRDILERPELMLLLRQDSS